MNECKSQINDLFEEDLVKEDSKENKLQKTENTVNNNV